MIDGPIQEGLTFDDAAGSQDAVPPRSNANQFTQIENQRAAGVRRMDTAINASIAMARQGGIADPPKYAYRPPS